MLDGVPSLPNDQAHFARGDEDLLDGAIAIHVVVEARTIPTPLNDLTQQSLRLPKSSREENEI